MFFVKLFVALFVFTFLACLGVKIAVNNLPFKTRMEIAYGKDPTWLDVMSIIICFMVFVDVGLFIYSVLYLLFFG